jgi:signal transduction histidine kinase
MDSLDLARKYLNESLKLAGQSEDKLGIVSCYLKLGESFLKESNPSRAIFYIQDGLNIANETGSITLLELAHSLKARYFRQTGQKDSAMESMMKQLELRDSLSRQESGESIARLENRFKEEKNRLEIETLVKNKINARRLFLVIVTAISIILIIIFISLFQARKKGRILIEKNKEIENQQALLKVRNEELLKSQDELKKISEAKDQFLTILSHDLKNPVSAIRGFVELMINQYDLIPEEKKKLFLQEIFDSIEKISLLITNVLFWVRSQTRGIKNYPETFSLAGRIDTNLSLYKLIAKDKGIYMENLVPEGLEIFADVNIFDTIIRNLLSNSLKFTGKEGNIDISAEPSGRQILLKIKDTGVGISKEKLDKLLDPSYHISTSGTKKEPGTGLGLGLVKDFILLMGGDFRINSAQGIGTEFLLYFPVPRKN